jgi:hypothetical protein
MAVPRFDLGRGLVVTRTFAHFMAPFLMAFSPAAAGQPHPGPWSAVSEGISLDIRLQLHVPDTFSEPKFFDRLNTVWWIAALIRLRGLSRAHVPVISDRPFEDIPSNSRDAKLLPVEVLPRNLPRVHEQTELTFADLEWLADVWLPGGQLMDASSAFNDAFQALDAAGAMPNSAVALLAVWGALEHLFSPAKQELRFRVSAAIASYLEPPGAGRLELHRALLKLYDARSSVAHGSRLKEDQSWTQTYRVATRVIGKMLAERHVPSKEELDALIFGAVTT